MSFICFETFKKNINQLQADQVIPALELQCQTLQHKFSSKGVTPTMEAFSIFTFRQFIYSVKLKLPMRCVGSIPKDHIAFYRDLITRLVHKDELPSSAIEDFERAFWQGEFAGNVDAVKIPRFVRYAGMKCLAYEDENGQWRSIYNNEPLPSAIALS